jgi:hypothetical protein
LTLIAIAAIAMSLNVAFHEGVHALACVVTGGRLLEYSALYESCDTSTVLQAKIVAGSAPTYNLLAGLLLWFILRRSKKRSSETRLFIWLFMLMNLFYGAGYFILSGTFNIGDWAVVIDGWGPGWAWRILMTIAGILLFAFFVRVGMREFAKMIGGDTEEQVPRARVLCVTSYLTSVVVVLLAGLFCPYGLLSLPVTAGTFAATGALSPFVLMMRWFRTEHAEKLVKKPLEIRRRWQWLVTAVVVVFTYVFVLGRTLYF